MHEIDGDGRNGTRTIWAGLLAAMLLAVSFGTLLPAAGAVEHGPLTGELCPEVADPTGGLVVGTLRCWDYGDAPDSGQEPGQTYPTHYTAPGAQVGRFPTLSDTQNTIFPGQSGARHQIVDVGWLGNVSRHDAREGCQPLDETPPTEEHDADAFPDEDVTVTNLDPLTGTPDHDGQDDGLYPALLQPGQDGVIRFRVSSQNAIREWHVNVLSDWDFDGRWDHDDEWIVRNFPVSQEEAISCVYEALIPSSLVGTTPGTPWVRITLTKGPINAEPFWDGSVTPSHGSAFDWGETEDICGRLVVGNETGSDERIVCRAEDEPSGDCSDEGIEQYSIDISTGRDANGPIAFGDADDDWEITRSPGGNWNGPAHVIPAITAWAQPADGRWVNPDFHSNGQNDPAPWYGVGHPGDGYHDLFVYEASFQVNDPVAQWVRFQGDWSRDDFASPPHSQGFQYRESAGNWEPIAAANGHAHKDPFVGVDGLMPGDDVESTYDLRVGVHNTITYHGLLVEGEIVVHCTSPIVDVPVPGGL